MATQDIVFDIGGMCFRSGLVDETGRVTSRVVFDSPANPDEVVEHIKRTVESLSVTAPHAAVGIAIGGIVERNGRVTSGAINVVDFPLAEYLNLKRPIVVLNDAKAAALAEATHNSRLAGKQSFVLMTISAGIGGGVVINGELYEGHTGTAGEVGHMVIDRGLDSYCRLGHRGCLDALASGRAVNNRLQTLWRDGHWTQYENGVELHDLPDLLKSGDGMAHCLVQETGRWIGVGIMSIIRVIDPCEVVFKGYLARVLWDDLHPHISAVLARYDRQVPMSLSSLGEDVGLVGAGIAARRLREGLVSA